MSVKTISIRTPLYRKLRSPKRAGESFRDVIARLLHSQQPPLTRHAGAWKPITDSEIKDIRQRAEELRHPRTRAPR